MRRTLGALLTLLLLAPTVARADKFIEEMRAAVQDLGRRDASVEVKRAALDTLIRLGGGVQQAGGQALADFVLHDRQEEVRVKAARTIWQLGPTAAEWAIAFELPKALRDGSPAVRMEVISVLVQAGRLAPKQVLPALAQVCQDDSSAEVRLWAAAGLVRIYLGLGPAAPDTPVPALPRNHPVEDRATLVPVLREAGKVLASALQDPDEQGRAKAAVALGAIGPTGGQFPIHELIRAFQDTKSAVRAEVVFPLASAGRWKPGLVLPELLRGMKDEDNHVRLRVAGCMWVIGPRAREAVPALIEALKDTAKIKDNRVGWESVRAAALWSLARMGPAAKGALPAVVDLLDSGEPQVRRDALKVLETVGDSDERVAPALLKALKHKEKEVRVLAAVNLGQMGPKYAKDALPLLLDGLDVSEVKDQSEGGQADSRQYLIVRALGKMGPVAAEAVPRLRALLNDPRRGFVRQAVEQALKQIEP
jgi:HEAT repeat protein